MKYKSLAKILFSIILITALVVFSNLEELFLKLKSINIFNFALVIFLYFLGQLLSSYKWMLIAKSANINVKYFDIFKAYFTGMFINSFGLGVVGGDVARGLLLSVASKQNDNKSLCLASVIADRAHGLCVLALIGFVSILFFGTQTIDSNLIYFVAFLECCIVAGWFLAPSLSNKINKPVKIAKIIKKITTVFPSNPVTLIKISAVSLCFHLIQIIAHFVMAKALNCNISFTVLLVIVPFVNVLSTLPISWNGLGVRESGYKYFLAPTFISNADAIAFGAVWLIAVIINSAIGGIIAAVTGTNKLLKPNTPV